MRNTKKKQRQKMLKNLIEKDPFLTDKELANKFNVSIQTIRLDRMELGIPELRERTKNVAQNAYQDLIADNEGEVIGELIDLKLNNYAVSFLKSKKEMAFKDTNIIRGHHIFAQANSLAVAVLDDEIVLTGKSDVKFLKTVKVGDNLRAKAELKDVDRKKYYIDVNTFCNNIKVFSGQFVMFVRKKEEIQ
ncbi:MAG: transcription factor FapR [Bacillota bacterium]